MANLTSEAVEVQLPPAEMRARRQWVAFKREPRPGQPKPAKVPYKAADQRASITNPADWLTYDAAVALAAQPGFAGVGFVFAPHDGLVGIDLDGARDPATGTIEPWARAVVERFGSYTEVSPSGTGLHVIARGAITAAVKTARVEIYDRARYFTVTGDVLDNRNTIVDASDLEAFAAEHRASTATTAAATPTDLPPVKNAHLTDDELLARIKGKRTKVEQRLRGYFKKDGERDTDQSKDDYQLAVGLVKYVGGDVDRIERLMRQSALERAKWDRRGDDYLRRTILRAAQAVATGARPPAEMPTFSGISVLLTEPRQYEVTADGATLRIDSRTLLSPLLFERALLEVTNQIMPPVTKQQWRDIIQPLLDRATIIEAPEDATTLGRLRGHVLVFLQTRHKSDSLDDVLLGKAAVDPKTGNICFLSESLFGFLDRRGWKVGKGEEAEVYASLRRMGARWDRAQRSIKGAKRRLWWFPPEFVEGEEQTEPFTHPDGRARPY